MSSRSKLTSLNVSNALTCVLQLCSNVPVTRITAGNPHSHAYCNSAAKKKYGGFTCLATCVHMRIATCKLLNHLHRVILATCVHMRIATRIAFLIPACVSAGNLRSHAYCNSLTSQCIKIYIRWQPAFTCVLQHELLQTRGFYFFSGNLRSHAYCNLVC